MEAIDAATAKLVAEQRIASWVCEVDGILPWLGFKNSYDQWLSANPPQERLVNRLAEVQGLKWFLRATLAFFVEALTIVCIVFQLIHLANQMCMLRRLYAYMLIAGAPFGVLIHNEVTMWYAKMERDPGHSVHLCVSSPIAAWWGLGFLLDSARRTPLQQQTGAEIVRLGKLRMSMGPDVRELFKCIAKRTKEHFPGIVNNIKDLKLEELEDLKGMCLRDTEVVSAIYMGKRVVLKVRDLTTPWGDVDSQMLKVVTEVDMYTTLHRLQGVFIPRLISWGFICNNMFAYVMISDEGTEVSSFISFGKGVKAANRQTVEAALPLAQEALAKVHARGVLLGDVRAEKFVYRASSSGKLDLKMVGFSKASRVSQSKMPVAGSLEMARLDECFKRVLMDIQVAEGRAVENLLYRLEKDWVLLDQFPEIKELLIKLGAKEPTSAPNRPESSAAPYRRPQWTMTTELDVPLITATLERLVDDQTLLQQPAFTMLRTFLRTSQDG